MAKGNLTACLAFTLEYEGGYVNHPKDPGGATNFGVTQAVYDRWRRARNKTAQSVRLITKAEVEVIYQGGYWQPVRGDDLPKGPDLTIFDYGVNSGPSRSVKDAQRVLGVSVDGVLGDRETLPALLRFPAREFVKKHCARRLGFVQGLKIWDTFGKGWSRRIAAVEARGLSWVSSKPQLERDAKEARDKAAGQAGGAVATGGGGVAVDQAPDVTGFPWWLILLVVALVSAPLIIRAVINAQRAAALSKVAKAALIRPPLT